MPLFKIDSIQPVLVNEDFSDSSVRDSWEKALKDMSVSYKQTGDAISEAKTTIADLRKEFPSEPSLGELVTSLAIHETNYRQLGENIRLIRQRLDASVVSRAEGPVEKSLDQRHSEENERYFNSGRMPPEHVLRRQATERRNKEIYDLCSEGLGQFTGRAWGT